MPAFNTEVSHPLGKEEATTRRKSFLEKVKERYKDMVSQLDGTWADNILDFSLTTYGIKISGKLTVEEDKATINGQLPFAALAFKGKITQTITQALEKELATEKA